jgi:exopolyphosphatase / guanosine-5'-triphosphate,3'-diphosphate pyrophosphatase
MPKPVASRGDVVAVIDIGSNSGRVVVFERDAMNHLRTLAGSRASLRLVRDVDERGELSDATMARATEVLRDFQAIATGAGATRIVAVATAAMRDSANGALLATRIRRELGIRIDVIGGSTEARYGFTGAVRGLAVSNGLLFDLGGGSMQLTRFTRRRRMKDISMPLGALRLSEKFLESDPPTRKQIRRLREHIRSHLAKASVTPLGSGERLVGAGGTVRNLAKLDRRARNYPIGSLHGYELPIDRLGEGVDLLASTPEKRRDELPGLSAERADSIVGGAIAIQTLAEFVRATHILVSGQGIREGIALNLYGIRVGSPDSVKEASLSSLESRFDGWRPDAAARRRSVASALCRAIEPRAPSSVSIAIDHAARVLDIGRSLDVVNRHEHVAGILLSTELNGFTHQELALVSSIVRRAGDRHAAILPLALRHDGVGSELIERAAILLSLADEIEARCPRGRPIAISCQVDRDVRVSIPMLLSWLVKDLDKRFARAFKRSLIVRR